MLIGDAASCARSIGLHVDVIGVAGDVMSAQAFAPKTCRSCQWTTRYRLTPSGPFAGAVLSGARTTSRRGLRELNALCRARFAFSRSGGSPAEYRAEVRVEHRRLRPRCAGRLAPTKLPIPSSASLRQWSPVASRCSERSVTDPQSPGPEAYLRPLLCGVPATRA
jgi:hypothetical protein